MFSSALAAFGERDPDIKRWLCSTGGDTRRVVEMEGAGGSGGRRNTNKHIINTKTSHLASLS